jgi:hypothetical protein
VFGFQTVPYELLGGALGMSCHMLQWNHDPTIVDNRNQAWANAAVFDSANGN